MISIWTPHLNQIFSLILYINPPILSTLVYWSNNQDMFPTNDLSTCQTMFPNPQHDLLALLLSLGILGYDRVILPILWISNDQHASPSQCLDLKNQQQLSCDYLLYLLIFSQEGISNHRLTSYLFLPQWIDCLIGWSRIPYQKLRFSK